LKESLEAVAHLDLDAGLALRRAVDEHQHAIGGLLGVAEAPGLEEVDRGLLALAAAQVGERCDGQLAVARGVEALGHLAQLRGLRVGEEVGLVDHPSGESGPGGGRGRRCWRCGGGAERREGEQGGQGGAAHRSTL
jgi:hypothetical protein